MVLLCNLFVYFFCNRISAFLSFFRFLIFLNFLIGMCNLLILDC